MVDLNVLDSFKNTTENIKEKVTERLHQLSNFSKSEFYNIIIYSINNKGTGDIITDITISLYLKDSGSSDKCDFNKLRATALQEAHELFRTSFKHIDKIVDDLS